MIEDVRSSVVRIRTDKGSGSGVIFELDDDVALVLTNDHVVENARDIQVEVNDSMTYKAESLGTDSVRDLAVLRICCGEFRALPFGNVSELKPGDEVFAMGYALGLQGEATVTRGIISAIRYLDGRSSLVIQTDAAINPGNSGGPMLSEAGEIVGINAFGIRETNTGTNVEGVGFAIAAPTIQEQLHTLKTSPQPTAEPTPQPTPELTPRPTSTPTPSGEYAFGPLNGEIQTSSADIYQWVILADVVLEDVMVEATFSNPLMGADQSWLYLIDIRRDLADDDRPGLTIGVLSNGRWVLTPGDDPSAQIASGSVTNLNLGPGRKNRFMVIAIQDRGWLFVNNGLVSEFDLGGYQYAGEVSIAALILDQESSDVQAAVPYENFRGYDLRRRYGPASGTIEHIDDGFIGTHSSGVVSRDFIARAVFHNPPDAAWSSDARWDYGFLFRTTTSNQREVISVHSSGQWSYQTFSVGANEYTELGSGRLDDWREGLVSSNYLLLIAMGDTGWFFVNGEPVAPLILDFNMERGEISAIAGFYNNSNQDVIFGNFEVWTP